MADGLLSTKLLRHSASDDGQGDADVLPRRRADGFIVGPPLWGITTPWSLRFFFTTVEGLETVHVYLWVMKEICWATNQFELAMVFGGLALAW